MTAYTVPGGTLTAVASESSSPAPGVSPCLSPVFAGRPVAGAQCEAFTGPGANGSVS